MSHETTDTQDADVRTYENVNDFAIARQVIDEAEMRKSYEADPEGFTPFWGAYPAELDGRILDEGFVSFAVRYVRRKDHAQFGELMLMAEAWGLEVSGDYVLVAAHDHNLIIWPRCSYSFIQHLLAIIATDEVSIHPSSGDEAHKGSFGPGLKEVDPEEYNAETPQKEPRYLPMVFCAKLEGLGLEIHQSATMESYELRRTFAEAMESMMTRLFGAEGIRGLFESEDETEGPDNGKATDTLISQN